MINGSITKQGGADVLVIAGATATLYVTGSAKLSSLVIQPGAVVKVYVGGPSADIAGVNTSGNNPYCFQLWGLPTLTSAALTGNDLPRPIRRCSAARC